MTKSQHRKKTNHGPKQDMGTGGFLTRSHGPAGGEGLAAAPCWATGRGQREVSRQRHRPPLSELVLLDAAKETGGWATE